MTTKEKIIILDNYHLQDSDEGFYPNYYGFINDIGDWYIIKELSYGIFRYVRSYFNPTGLYSNKWSNRTVLTYVFWETSF